MRTRNPRTVACLVAAVTLLLAATVAGSAVRPGKVLRLAHAEWSSSVASANLAKAVLERKLGIRCELVPMTADLMWESVARKDADAMLSAWLPDTHSLYHEQYADGMVDLGPNLDGTRTGLVVPDVTLGRLTAGTGIRNQPYIDIDSIPEMRDKAAKFEHRIVGIEPQAGIMYRTREAMDVYGLDDYRLVESSEVAMTAELSNAIRHQKWIVVTGWLPHWSFARWSLKFLDDPRNVYGDRGRIHTFARPGLKGDNPEAWRFLDRFHWEPEDMGQLMLWIHEDGGRFPYEKALRWIRVNPDKVAEWIE
ncbi:MAG: glycine betaine ABC transporter substrate-binding protein [Desulfatibacillaceae bacterium]